MQRIQHRELPDFLACAAGFYPALQGEMGSHQPGNLMLGKDNRQPLEALYGYWRQSFPEAGMAYWSARSWTMLVWQPVFLAVFSVHGCQLLPNLSSLSQRLYQGVVAGFSLTSIDVQQGSENQLILRGGWELRQMCDQLLAELNQITRIKPVNAMRLVADSLLSAIGELQRIYPHLSNERTLQIADQWLAATDLQGQSTLIPVPQPDGHEQLALSRKGCCFHYLRRDGELCASCPKQCMPKRSQHPPEERECHA